MDTHAIAPRPAEMWRDDEFNVLVVDRGGVTVDLRFGYVWRGLGLAHHGWAEPRTATRWTLYHLGSGSRIIGLRGAVVQVFPAASDIAALTDWTAFDLPSGWRNVTPDLPQKLAELVAALPQARVWWAPDNPAAVVSDDDARAFFAMREAHA